MPVADVLAIGWSQKNVATSIREMSVFDETIGMASPGVGIGVGFVTVGRGVAVTVGRSVGVFETVGVGVSVGVGESVAVRVEVAVTVGVAVRVGVGVAPPPPLHVHGWQSHASVPGPGPPSTTPTTKKPGSHFVGYDVRAENGIWSHWADVVASPHIWGRFWAVACPAHSASTSASRRRRTTPADSPS